ncbi:MAG: hypothetical protein K8S27_06795 [Candidatus Omnitrophica bacterium]|nr:hypothetical protein [Candidatus Omnitrophota bacterium]
MIKVILTSMAMVSLLMFTTRDKPDLTLMFAAMSPPASMATSPSDLIADWEIYRNEEQGYEIRYPRDFAIVEGSYGTEFIPPSYQKNQGCEPICPTFMFIRIDRATAGESLEHWIKEYWGLKEFREFRTTPEASDWWIDFIKGVTIGEHIQGYKLHLWRQAWGVNHYYGKRNDLRIDIQRGEIGLGFSSYPDDAVFNQMLSSFSLIER